MAKTTNETNITDVYTYITQSGGLSPDKLAAGSIIKAENGKELTVERSNGFCITGFWNGSIYDQGGIDLRCNSATLVSVAS